MPNFRAKKVDLSKLPLSANEVEFAWASTPQNGCSLILAKVGSEQTLLQISKKSDFYVCKVEKSAKLSELSKMQKALLAFKDSVCDEVIDEACALNERQNLASNILLRAEEINALAEDKKLFIEIGFGSGRHLLARASSQPEDIFIGIEIHRPSLLQASKLAKAQNLSNVYFLDADARIVLECLRANSLSGVFVHFPVPWPDAPQRRVVSADFERSCLAALKVGGFFELRSDEEFYFNYAKEIFSKPTWELKERKNQEGFKLSKYEARWQRQGKDIYDLIAVKKADSRISKLEQSALISPFACDNLRKVFVKNASVFAKLARIYDTPAGTLALVHFGAFDKPTSAYLLFSKHKACEFITKLPANSADNCAAWELLKASLCSEP